MNKVIKSSEDVASIVGQEFFGTARSVLLLGRKEAC